MAVVEPTTGETATAVSALRAQLQDALGGLDPELLSTTDAAALLEDVAGIEMLAAGARAVLARRAAASDRWKRAGAKTPEDWLADQAGTSKAEAHKTLATSERLHGLDETKAALLAGKLSARQAETVAAGAAADPHAEGELLATATLEPLAALQDKAAKVKAAAQPDPARAEAQIHAQRQVRQWTDLEGAGCLFARGSQRQMARLRRRLEHELDAVFAHNRKAGNRERLEAYTYDALHRLLGTTDNEETPAEATGAPAKRDELLVHAHLRPLLTGQMAPGDVVEIPGVGPYPLDAARQLLGGDAIVRLVVTHGTDIAAVVTNSRHATVAIQTALSVRDGRRCVVPGCGRRGIEVHHTASATGFADTGQTPIDHLAWVCKHHHHDLTHRHATLAGSHQTGWRFTPPPPERAKPTRPKTRKTKRRRR